MIIFFIALEKNAAKEKEGENSSHLGIVTYDQNSVTSLFKIH